MNKKLLIVMTILALMSGITVASLPNVAGDITSSLYNMVRSVQVTLQTIQQTVQAVQATVQNTNETLNNVKVETVISGPPITVGEEFLPGFIISANETWDLMAVYITSYGFNTSQVGSVPEPDQLFFGVYGVGSREYQSNIMVANGADAVDFPLFPGDITGGTQSIIAVPAGVQVVVYTDSWAFGAPGPKSVAFKIVIQNPIDPGFAANVTWGV